MEPLARLPVFLALEGKRAVVAGGTPAAAWKAELLSAAGAAVEVYAAEPCDELLALAADPPHGAIIIHRRAWTADDIRRRRHRYRRLRKRRRGGALCRRGRAPRRSGQRHRQAEVLRLLVRRHRQPLAAGDRHLDRRRGAGVRPGHPRQARRR